MKLSKLTAAALCIPMMLLVACHSKPKDFGPSPDTFRARFNTTKGDFVILVHRDWAPHGADRFYELMKLHFFDNNYFFRVLPGFIVQWGINGDPKVAKDWDNLSIPDDPAKVPNKRGTVTFANAGPNTRTTQLFVNLRDNPNLDQQQGFTPFGEVSEGMNVIESFYSQYGEGAPNGSGPDQRAITSDGNDYLVEHFPHLDHIKKAEIVP